METDRTTLQDLSIFHHDAESSVFDKIDYTRTTGGREKLRQIFNRSLTDIPSIIDMQRTLKLIAENRDKWPLMISNGTVTMIYKFYESSIDEPPSRPTPITAYLYKLFHGPDFSLVKYSIGHAFDFIKGMQQLVSLLLTDDAPSNLKRVLQKAEVLIQKHQFSSIPKLEKPTEFSNHEMLAFAYYIRYHYKQNFLELIEIYSLLDAWYGMAVAVDSLKLSFPEFIDTDKPVLQAKNLYHILLEEPVAYDVNLDQQHNFIFLTGANMAGKSTFIKAVGSAAFMAHIGMGVPADDMQLSLFDGLLSNINVADNIVKGESYFYNEVQRIKNTIIKVNDGRKWLILIDELFKGTNVEDAMKCSTVVIEGLIKIKKSLFILSTHLYQIAESLQNYSNIDFKYFETRVEDEKLIFNYSLKEGVSNDRLGYLILKKEKVLDLLDSL